MFLFVCFLLFDSFLNLRFLSGAVVVESCVRTRLFVLDIVIGVVFWRSVCCLCVVIITRFVISRQPYVGVSMGDWQAHPFMRRPHCVIFVLPANQFKIPDALITFVSTLRQEGYDPLFAITKIDCHGSGSHDVYAGAGLFDEKRDEVIEYLGASHCDIFPVSNYTQVCAISLIFLWCRSLRLPCFVACFFSLVLCSLFPSPCGVALLLSYCASSTFFFFLALCSFCREVLLLLRRRV